MPINRSRNSLTYFLALDIGLTTAVPGDQNNISKNSCRKSVSCPLKINISTFTNIDFQGIYGTFSKTRCKFIFDHAALHHRSYAGTLVSEHY